MVFAILKNMFRLNHLYWLVFASLNEIIRWLVRNVIVKTTIPELSFVFFFPDPILGHQFVKLSGGYAGLLGGFFDFALVSSNEFF